MDKVRFGRALGYGARHAAKSVMQAVDAATAPDPAPRQLPGARATAPAQPDRFASSRQSVTHAAAQARTLSPQAARSVWKPLARFSSVLWLEVTGTFFVVFALYMAGGVWRLHDAWRLAPTTHEAQQLYLHATVFAVFAYFAVSSFVRAGRRQRK
jgi:hypothetical protein